MSSRDRFPVMAANIITHEGEILIGRKENREGHPISGMWHLLGGHIDHGEGLEQGVRREVREETGLESRVQGIVDAMTFPWKDGQEKNALRFVFHVKARSHNAEPDDDLAALKWVNPEDLTAELGERDAQRVQEREAQRKFVEQLKQN